MLRSAGTTRAGALLGMAGHPVGSRGKSEALNRMGRRNYPGPAGSANL